MAPSDRFCRECRELFVNRRKSKFSWFLKLERKLELEQLGDCLISISWNFTQLPDSLHVGEEIAGQVCIDHWVFLHSFINTGMRSFLFVFGHIYCSHKF